MLSACTMKRILLIFALFALCHSNTYADVVKPALIEVSVYSTGEVEVSIRASIEALLTGINARYKNTQDAPSAGEYDQLRALQGQHLKSRFVEFQQEMLDQVELQGDDKKIELTIDSVKVPEPGYTKVPRISVIVLKGRIEKSAVVLPRQIW